MVDDLGGGEDDFRRGEMEPRGGEERAEGRGGKSRREGEMEPKGGEDGAKGKGRWS